MNSATASATLDNIAGANAPGHQGIFGMMGNLLFDIGHSPSFQPYVGGGIGVGWNKWSNVQAARIPGLSAGYAIFNDTSPAVFQYQGIAGVSVPVAAKAPTSSSTTATSAR